ncbi:class I SAM-dependent methyltransferase [Candidatus Parcubacteria bacterium]|nr:class I SAM-dependent methyltransferase [Candidatus Parcubacteria bacterium]
MEEESKYSKINFKFEALKNCPLCEFEIMIPNGKINWLDTDFWYVICPKCGLKYMNPQPTKGSYQNFYKELFWQQKIRNLGFKQSDQIWNIKKYKWDNNYKWNEKEGKKNRIEKHKAQRIKTILPVIKEHIALNENSNILEVGSGFGVTLEAFYEKYKCNVFAIEPSEEARKTMKKQGNIFIIGKYAEELEGLSKDNKKYDVIIFSHSLENIVNPFNVLKYASKCLKQGGLIYIQTPNLLVFDQMNPYHPYIFSSSSVSFLAHKLNIKYTQISKAIDQMLVVILNTY